MSQRITPSWGTCCSMYISTGYPHLGQGCGIQTAYYKQFNFIYGAVPVIHNNTCYKRKFVFYTQWSPSFFSISDFQSIIDILVSISIQALEPVQCHGHTSK